MDYQDFLKNVKKDLRDVLESRIGDVTIEERKVEKLQGQSYSGIDIHKEGATAGMVLNMEGFYREMEKGKTYKDVLHEIAATISNHFTQITSIAAEEFEHYESMNERLTMEVVSTEKNQAMLSKIRHTELENMSIIYRLDMESNADESRTIIIINDIIDTYKISTQQLHQDAIENAPKIHSASVRSMEEVLSEILGEEKFPQDVFKEPSMYVATAEEASHGAEVVAFPGFMEEGAKKVGGDFFVLPSSLYEVLLVPDKGNMDYRELKEMVSSINASQVEPQDRLTDSVYHYDSKDKVFELAEKYEERQAARAHEEHSSVLGDLGDKKQKHARKPVKKKVVQKHTQMEL